MELAARGHEIHFISYAPPVRLDFAKAGIEFHEVEVSTYPLFDHAPYAPVSYTHLDVYKRQTIWRERAGH